MTIDDIITEKDRKLSIWYSKKTELANRAASNEHERHIRKVYQKGIYWVEMGENIGREMGQLHPALVISDNQWNSNGTATILPLTSDTEQLWDTRYILSANDYPKVTTKNNRQLPGLTKDSMVKADQPKTASVERFHGQITRINNRDWQIVQKRIKKYLGL